MTARLVSTTTSPARRLRRMLGRSGNVDRALPSELALRPIEPHYLMRR